MTSAQQSASAAVALGLTPRVIAASGYCGPEAGSIFANTTGATVLAGIQARCTASGTHRPTGTSTSMQQSGSVTGASGSTTAAAASDTLSARRGQLLSTSIGNDQPARLARLDRVASGVAVGLPANIAAACNTAAERGLAAKAQLAETRAAALGEPLAPRWASILAALRASPDAVQTDQHIATSLDAVQAQFPVMPTP